MSGTECALCHDGRPFGSCSCRGSAGLLRGGAKHVDQAIANNPDGPVLCICDISKTEIVYEVCVGHPGDSTSHRGARTIWYKVVCFGADDAHQAAGAAFVAAGREQDAIAWAALEILEARR